MERKIGEIFEYNGEWYQCVKDTTDEDCDECNFHRYCNFDVCGFCSSDHREDKQSVCFKKLEKVGQPYPLFGRIVQRYSLFAKPVVLFKNPFACYYEINKTIDIEVKQNKEDMEEKELVEILSEKVHNAWMEEKKAQGFTYGEKYDDMNKKHPDMLPYKELSEKVKEYDRVTVRAVLKAQQELRQDSDTKLNLKPFNLEAAKAGKPVCTRDGRKARIICFDKKDEDNLYPIVCLIQSDGEEHLAVHMEDGHALDGVEETPSDLMMLPEKKEGWVNVYKERIYSTKEEAIEATYDGVTYVDTVKVCWEE